MRPDKKSITDEVWDDERIRTFLVPRPPQGGDSTDFGLLLNAYRGMRIDDFVRFLRFFCAEQRNLDAKNEQGQTFVEFISTHRHGKPFAEAVKAAAAAGYQP